MVARGDNCESSVRDSTRRVAGTQGGRRGDDEEEKQIFANKVINIYDMDDDMQFFNYAQSSLTTTSTRFFPRLNRPSSSKTRSD